MNHPTKFEILKYCSGEVLTNYIPDNWEDLTEEEKTQYVEENVSYRYRDYTGEDIIEAMDMSMYSLISFLGKHYSYKEN